MFKIKKLTNEADENARSQLRYHMYVYLLTILIDTKLYKNNKNITIMVRQL